MAQLQAWEAVVLGGASVEELGNHSEVAYQNFDRAN